VNGIVISSTQTITSDVYSDKSGLIVTFSGATEAVIVDFAYTKASAVGYATNGIIDKSFVINYKKHVNHVFDFALADISVTNLPVVTP